MPNISIEQVMDMGSLQELQDAFSEFTGLASIVTDRTGRQVTNATGFSDVCLDYVRTSKEQVRKCMDCCINAAFEAQKTDGPYIYKCHAGLVCLAAPVMVDNSIVGCLCSGQVICSDDDERQIFLYLAKMGYKTDECVRITEGLKRISLQELHRAAAFLYKMAHVVSAVAQKNVLLMNKDLENDNSTSPWLRDYVSSIKHPERERIFNTTELFSSIVDVCTELCRENNCEFAFEHSDNIPALIFGNAKLLKSGIEAVVDVTMHFSKCSKVTVAVDYRKEGYSSVLTIDVMSGQHLSADEIYGINTLMYSNELGTEKNVVKLTDFFITKLSGTIKAVDLGEKGVSIHITVPQLTDKESNNGR